MDSTKKYNAVNKALRFIEARLTTHQEKITAAAIPLLSLCGPPTVLDTPEMKLLIELGQRESVTDAEMAELVRAVQSISRSHAATAGAKPPSSNPAPSATATRTTTSQPAATAKAPSPVSHRKLLAVLLDFLAIILLCLGVLFCVMRAPAVLPRMPPPSSSLRINFPARFIFEEQSRYPSRYRTLPLVTPPVLFSRARIEKGLQPPAVRAAPRLRPLACVWPFFEEWQRSIFWNHGLALFPRVVSAAQSVISHTISNNYAPPTAESITMFDFSAEGALVLAIPVAMLCLAMTTGTRSARITASRIEPRLLLDIMTTQARAVASALTRLFTRIATNVVAPVVRRAIASALSYILYTAPPPTDVAPAVVLEEEEGPAASAVDCLFQLPDGTPVTMEDIQNLINRAGQDALAASAVEYLLQPTDGTRVTLEDIQNLFDRVGQAELAA